MSKHVIFFGWNRSIPGREHISAEQFQEFTQYLGGLQQEGVVDSFEPVLLSAHGGDMNGFFLIRGDVATLDDLQRTEEWLKHMVRAGLHLEGAGAIRGVTGEGVMEWMSLWAETIPT